MIEQTKRRMRHEQGAIWVVESQSHPGIGHRVDVLNLRCGCPAGRHGRRCVHLVLAIQADAWRRGIQARAQAEARGATAVPAALHKTAGYHGLAEAFA